jgi:CBS domain-containing protein
MGWFIQSGAQTYLQHHELSAALDGVRLRDIMNPKFVSIRQNQTVSEALGNYFNVYRKSEFPVLDAEGYLVGAVTNQQAMSVSEKDAEKVMVDKIMTPKKGLVIMNASSRADEALKRIYQQNKNRIFVCDDCEYDITLEQGDNPKNNEMLLPGNGKINIRLLGIISKTDLLNVAREREEFDRISNK